MLIAGWQRQKEQSGKRAYSKICFICLLVFLSTYVLLNILICKCCFVSCPFGQIFNMDKENDVAIIKLKGTTFGEIAAESANNICLIASISIYYFLQKSLRIVFLLLRLQFFLSMNLYVAFSSYCFFIENLCIVLSPKSQLSEVQKLNINLHQSVCKLYIHLHIFSFPCNFHKL